MCMWIFKDLRIVRFSKDVKNVYIVSVESLKLRNAKRID